MQLSISEVPPAPERPLVLTLSGAIDFSNRHHLIQTVAEALAIAPEVQIDASDVVFIDCAGLGALTELDRIAQRENAALRIEPRSEVLQRVLNLAGLGDAWSPDARAFR